MARKARKARKKKLGEEDTATCASISLFASVIKDQGRWEEVMMLEVHLMESRKIKLKLDYPNPLTSMNNSLGRAGLVQDLPQKYATWRAAVPRDLGYG